MCTISLKSRPLTHMHTHHFILLSFSDMKDVTLLVKRPCKSVVFAIHTLISHIEQFHIDSSHMAWLLLTGYCFFLLTMVAALLEKRGELKNNGTKEKCFLTFHTDSLCDELKNYFAVEWLHPVPLWLWLHLMTWLPIPLLVTLIVVIRTLLRYVNYFKLGTV